MTDEKDNEVIAGNGGDKWWERLLYQMLAPSARELGYHFKERVAQWRMKNLAKIEAKKQQLIGDAKTRAVPTKTAIEFVDAASMVDDEMLQTLWANLLCQYLVVGAEKRESFVGILHQLTPLEAQIFKALYEKQRKLKPEWRQRAWLGKDEVMERFNLSEDDYVVAHQDMLRIGIISRPTEKYLMRYEFFTPHNYTMPISEMGVAFGDYVIAPGLARGGGEPDKGAD